MLINQTQQIQIPDGPLAYTFTDDGQQVTVALNGTNVSFVIWSGSAYTAAGQYTASNSTGGAMALDVAIAAYLASIAVS